MRVVNSLDELLRLPRDRRVNGFGAREPLQLEIPTLARAALIRAQGALNDLQERCGCLAGAAAMFVVLVFGVIEVFQRNVSLLAWRAISELGIVLVAAFVLGFVGKMAALAITRWQFAHRCRLEHRTLSRLLQPPVA
jgi:uncharacterized integral membrane protein